MAFLKYHTKKNLASRQFMDYIKGAAFQDKPQFAGCLLVCEQNSAAPVQLLFSCSAFQQRETEMF